MAFLTNNKLTVQGYLYKTKIQFKGTGNKIIFKKGAKINYTSIVLVGNNHIIEIDENVEFSEGGRIRIQGDSNYLRIGKGSSLVNVFFSIGDKNSGISIGKDCLMSANIIMRNNDDHSILEINNPETRINTSDRIVVEDHVWVSYGVTILKGVTIGCDSIIGTQSVVSKSIKKESLAVGIPAKVIKDHITWDRRWLNNHI